MAGPNILVFGDRNWDDSIAAEQRARLKSWLETLRGRSFVVDECGAGTAIPSVRNACEDISRQLGGTLIRINPREPDIPRGHVGLPVGAMNGLLEIRRILDTADSGEPGDQVL